MRPCMATIPPGLASSCALYPGVVATLHPRLLGLAPLRGVENKDCSFNPRPTYSKSSVMICPFGLISTRLSSAAFEKLLSLLFSV